MTLHLDDYWIWDFWLAPRQESASDFHVFFLQAPKSLGDFENRHNAARIGHATSSDLRDWTYHGVCFEPGSPDIWDDFTIWTGSVINAYERWYFFYTGRSRVENGNVQRIGLATSDNLFNWTRSSSNPIVEAASRWYVADGGANSKRVDCRDPWVTRDGDRWLMYFTATGIEGPVDGRGVIGLAESRDLVNWTVLPPVAAPGLFGEMEVPQPLPVGQNVYLLYCTAQHANVQGQQQSSWNGTHYLRGSSLDGPFELAPDPPLLADEVGTLYSARIVDDPWLGRYLLAWRRWNSHGEFVGEISDPLPIRITPEKSLTPS